MKKPTLTKVQAITAAEAARRLRKAPKTIYDWLDNGKLHEVTTEDEAVRLVAIDDNGQIVFAEEG